MFACIKYPENKKFLELVKKEAQAVIERLGNHPSIVIWCGDNETDRDYHTKGSKINKEILSRICRQFDTSRPYWRSSPSGGEHPNSMKQGDRHNWDIWHGKKPYKNYEKDTGKFISEFGIQSLPCKETLLKFMPKKNTLPRIKTENLKVWNYHNVQLDKINNYIKEFGDYKNVDEFITISQLTQAEIYKFAIEHYRSRKFDCGGALLWQFNEPWPTICWSIVDYHLNPKMAYFYVKRAFNNILIYPMKKKENILVYLINDSLKKLNGTVEFLTMNFDGEILFKKIFQEEINPNLSKLIMKQNIRDLNIINDKSNFVFIKYIYKEKILSENILFLSEFKKLKFNYANILYNITSISKYNKNYKHFITLQTDRFIPVVELKLPGIKDHKISDNFFFLIPHQKKEVCIVANKEFSKKDLKILKII